MCGDTAAWPRSERFRRVSLRSRQDWVAASPAVQKVLLLDHMLLPCGLRPTGLIPQMSSVGAPHHRLVSVAGWQQWVPRRHLKIPWAQQSPGRQAGVCHPLQLSVLGTQTPTKASAGSGSLSGLAQGRRRLHLQGSGLTPGAQGSELTHKCWDEKSRLHAGGPRGPALQLLS